MDPDPGLKPEMVGSIPDPDLYCLFLVQIHHSPCACLRQHHLRFIVILVRVKLYELY